ncbi:dihydrofolate reductase family protein [Nonomuraea sp. NPDC048901]|uniref:dihydrofolate reductase family protein n=1 Tax=Nonomuraea sp. NPDC048901 TaxID=3155627 RepID=UPI0034079B00
MKIVVTTNVTLDGVAQAPGRPDEDPRGGFSHGGWALPYSDHIMGAVMGRRMTEEGSLLLGRRTYEDLFGYWPEQNDGNPFTEVLNRTHKYVASRTPSQPLPWVNSTLLDGDAVEAVAGLRAQPGPTLGVIGSLDLVRQLARRDLIDEYVLLTHPLVLGTGSRLFADDSASRPLRLTDSVTTTTGVVIATYQRETR